MAADGLEELNFENKQIQSLIQRHISIYQEEKKRIDTNVRNYQSFEPLVDEFEKYVQPYEGVIPYMYVDSNGYPTIGCGHLIGFDWNKKNHTFWKNPIVESLEKKLNTQMSTNNLGNQSDFRNLAIPADINKFLTFLESDYLKLYEIPCVCYGFLDALGIGKTYNFEQCNDTHLSLRIKEDNYFSQSNPKESALERVGRRIRGIRKNPIKDMNAAVFKAYTLLISLSIKLRARQKFLGKAGHNPFGGASFYTFNNFNIKESENTDQKFTNSSSSRIDYSEGYKESASDFKEPPKEFNGILTRDLMLVRYHGDSPEQTYKWVTPALWANQKQTLEEILNAAALLTGWGEKTHIVLIKIPAGTKVRFLHGKADLKTDQKLNEIRPGGIEQYRLYDFDPNWIIAKRAIPLGHGYNNLILTADKIEEIEKRDIFLKIAELDARFKHKLKYFPLSAQLALLDLAFNMGVGALDKQIIQASLDQNWELLVNNTGWYHRKDSPNRNKQVKAWFLEASKAKQFVP